MIKLKNGEGEWEFSSAQELNAYLAEQRQRSGLTVIDLVNALSVFVLMFKPSTVPHEMANRMIAELKSGTFTPDSGDKILADLKTRMKDSKWLGHELLRQER